MKLSFSNRGWKELSFERMLEIASEMGFSGIELYNLHCLDSMTEKGGPFHKYNTASTARQLRESSLSVPCFDTSCDISADISVVSTVIRLMEIARDANVPYVVVCALNDDENAVRSALTVLLTKAEQLGVSILVKTSGIYADTSRLRTLLEGFASDRLSALWDVHHTYRDNGESSDDTIKNLGAYICHVHVRDSDDSGCYQLIGEGSMPIDEVMRALSSVNYDAFISLEWKPEWLEELSDPEIIFPHFVNYMSRFHSTRDMKKTLYFNHDGTGQYIWKRTSLSTLPSRRCLTVLPRNSPISTASSIRLLTIPVLMRNSERTLTDSLAHSFRSV